MRRLKDKSKPPGDGWEEHGGYMKAKLRKLQEQTSPAEAPISNIFAGVRIYVNGYTVPSADILHRLVQQHGGSFTNYFSKSAGDFMIASNLAQSKIKNITDHKIVKPAWITASIQSGKLLSWRNFELYPTGGGGYKQKGLRKISSGSLKQARFPVKPPSLPASPDGTKPSTSMDPSASAGVTSPSKSPPVQTRLDYLVPGLSPSPRKVSLSPQSEVKSSLGLGCLLRTGSTPTKKSSSVIEGTTDPALPKTSPTEKTEPSSSGIGPLSTKPSTSLDLSASADVTCSSKSPPVQKRLDFIMPGLSPSLRKANLSPQSPVKSSLGLGRLLRTGSTPTKKRSSVIEGTTDPAPSKISPTEKTGPTSPGIEPPTACSSSSMTSTQSGSADYIATFYARSRLHHLSTWASDLRDLVRSLRGNLPDSEKRLGQDFLAGEIERLGWEAVTIQLRPSTPSASRLLRPPILMHIDMDCFFVSVCLRNRPDLKGLPIAVTHSRGTKPSIEATAAGSLSEVASCSYEARKFGIKNGMHLGDARKLCPELKTVPYDFEAFHSVSQQLYKIVACFSLNIEAVSCDEMYVDLTDLLSPATYSPEKAAEPGRIINPFILGSELRRRVFEATGCTATCGFGTNRLLTRLATAKAKPNSQAFLIGASSHCAGAGNKSTPVDIVWRRADGTRGGGPAELSDCLIYEMDGGEGRDYLDSLPISNLPGIGYSTAERLLTKDVTTCGDLRQKLSLPQLSSLLGAKTGKRLYQLCQGKDSSDLTFDRFAKSVSAEINYGVRLASWLEVQEFVSSLASELVSRMKAAAANADDHLGVLGRTLVVRLLTRRADQPKEAVKFMGHGICDAWTRTVQLPTPTRDVSLITSQCMSVLRRINPDPTDIRGVGLQMQRLSPARNLKKSAIETAFPTVAKRRANAGASPSTDQSKPCSSSALTESSGTDDKKDFASSDSTPASGTTVDGTIARTPVDTSRSSEDESALYSPVTMKTPQLSVGPGVSVTSTPMHFTRPPAVKISPVKTFPSPKKSPGPSRARPQASPVKMPACSNPPPVADNQAASDGVRVFGKRSLEEIHCILAAWVSEVPAPEEEDIRMLAEYLISIVPTNLVRVRDILADLQRLLNSATAPKAGSPTDLWHTAFTRIKTVVDRTCKVHFGANCLSLSC